MHRGVSMCALSSVAVQEQLGCTCIRLKSSWGSLAYASGAAGVHLHTPQEHAVQGAHLGHQVPEAGQECLQLLTDGGGHAVLRHQVNVLLLVLLRHLHSAGRSQLPACLPSRRAGGRLSAWAQQQPCCCSAEAEPNHARQPPPAQHAPQCRHAADSGRSTRHMLGSL